MKKRKKRQQCIDNRAKSSANFYKAFAAGIWNNTRFGNKPLSSFAEYEHRNIANLSLEAAKEIEAKLLEERSQKYMETHNQKFQCKTAFIELVVNMREHHTLSNLGLIAELVEKTFGYTPTLLAIHADEGHYDPETGDFLANVHGHIRFCVLDPLDGTSLYLKEMRTTPDRQFSEFLEAFKNEIKRATEGAIINSINTLKCDKKQDGGHTIVGKHSQARNNGTYDVIKIVANQMSIAMNYGQNLRVAELEKIKKERDDVIKERDEAKEELYKANAILKKAKEAIEHWRSVAEAYQDAELEKSGKNVKVDPTAQTVQYNTPQRSQNYEMGR